MLECSYAKEPFDLRLTALRLVKKAWLIIGATLLGILIFGGGYYLKNVVLQEKLYGAESIYFVSYNTDPVTGNEYTYINDATWNTWVHTDDFIADLEKALEEICMEEGRDVPDLGREDIEVYMSAGLPTDLKMPYSTAATPDPELSLLLAGAAERSFVSFGERQKEINYIEVVESASKAERILSDARPLRACILSGVLTLFFTVMILLLKEMGEESIWLPSVLTSRFGLKAVGAVSSGGIVRLRGNELEENDFEQNIKYLFGKMSRAALVSTEESAQLQHVSEILQQISCNWLTVSSDTLREEGCETLREADGILLAVKAGSHAAKKLEGILQYLETQDCRVTAALLWDADEKLIRRYYFLSQCPLKTQQSTLKTQ